MRYILDADLICREFLTGFRKRNLELKKAKKERYEKKIKEEKLQKRREVSCSSNLPILKIWLETPKAEISFG